MGRGYERSAGHFVIDLTGVSGTHAISLSARLGIGQLEVIVPHDADVTVEAQVGAGNLALFEELNDGGYHQHKTRRSPGSGRHIQLMAKLGIGEIRVRRDPRPISMEGPTTTAALGTDGQVNTPTSEPPTPTTSARVPSPTATAPTAAAITSVTVGSIRHTWEIQR